jgi:hypothetical protein
MTDFQLVAFVVLPLAAVAAVVAVVGVWLVIRDKQ